MPSPEQNVKKLNDTVRPNADSWVGAVVLLQPMLLYGVRDRKSRWWGREGEIRLAAKG